MFGLGAKPTGSSDPFGLRRAALGVVRILREQPELALSVRDGLDDAAVRLREQGVTCDDAALDAAEEFTIGRYAQLLRDEGVSADVVSAVLPSAGRPGVADAHVAALTSLASDADFRALVEAIVRITRIVPADTSPSFDAALLTEPAEAALAQAVEATPQSDDLYALARGHASLVAPIATFFDDILVMADDPALKAARLGLLATIVAKAPAGLDWKAVDAATS